MKRMRVTKQNKVECPRINVFVDYNTHCIGCDDLVSSEQGMGNRYIICKRGRQSKDDYIRKEGGK